MKAAFIAFLLLIILFPLLYLLMGYFFKKTRREDYSFRSYFPYEFFKGVDGAELVLLRVMEGVSLLSGLLPVVFALIYLLPKFTSLSLYIVALTLAYLVPAASYVSLTIVPASFPKQHLTLFFVFAAGEILRTCMSGFLLLNFYGSLRNGSSLLVIAIALFVLALGIVCLVINPKLKRWDRMDNVANPDGTSSFIRPKWFVLAYSEWAIFAIGILSGVLSQIGFYLSYFAD